MPLIKSSNTLPAAQGWRPKQYLVMSVIAPFALFFALITAVELTAKQQQLHEQSLVRGNLADKTNEVRTLLEYELNSTLHLATGIVSYIQSKQGVLVASEIDPWLTNLQERAQHIRNIGIAPDNKITYVYPLLGNEAALGLYYPDNKEQWPAVQTVIANRRPMLAGPLNLQQGGLGLIYRIPVFLNNETYWGLVSTVLNFDTIYTAIHTRADQLGIKIAIKDRDQNGHILFGDSDVIANNELNLSILGRNWQMVSSQKNTAAPSLINTIRAGGWLITLAISLLFNSFLRSLAQQNQILRELNESKYRFSQAFKSAPQGIALINYTGTLIDFNKSLCNALGYNQDELSTQNFFALTASNQRERLINIVEGIYPKPGDNHQYETTLLHKNGHPINVIISLAPTHTNTYESDWIVQIIDISHRIAFEQLLQEEANYNQSILHAVVDAIITLDESGNIRSVNPAASRIFGYTEDQFIHHHINHFVQDPESGSIMRHIKYHSDKNDINTEINHEILGLKLNGEAFPIELQLSCIQRKQEKIFIAVVRDLSERKRLEQLKSDANRNEISSVKNQAN
jgi:two-component system sensor histidine kinase VicK